MFLSYIIASNITTFLASGVILNPNNLRKCIALTSVEIRIKIIIHARNITERQFELRVRFLSCIIFISYQRILTHCGLS